MKKFIKQLFITLFLLSPNIVDADPWYSVENEIIQLEIEQLRLCGIEVPPISAFPLNIIVLNKALTNIDQSTLNRECIVTVNSIKKGLTKNLYTQKNIIGFQSKRPEIYFQDFGKRLTADSHLYLSSAKVGDSFSYKISLQASKDDLRFDESYFSYYFNNHVFTIGRTSRWWSPSFNSSLILSNSARPSPGISFSNYEPKTINSKYLSFLGPIGYEFFLNRLEADRHIANPLLFGNRVSINPHHRLKISLFRTAQFGGEGRDLNTKIFINMLLGKDNAENDNQKLDEPGNQLGGIDFNLLLLKQRNLSFYGQVAGEDEAGYLPSRTFFLTGLSYSWDQLKTKKINLEYSDTGSRIKNYVYNHYLYKDGYRYLGHPIGSAYDADSKVVNLNFSQLINNNMQLHIKASRASLNYNNSNNFFINGLSDDVNIIEANIYKIFSKEIRMKLSIQRLNFKSTDKKSNIDAMATLEYRW